MTVYGTSWLICVCTNPVILSKLECLFCRIPSFSGIYFDSISLMTRGEDNVKRCLVVISPDVFAAGHSEVALISAGQVTKVVLLIT